MRPRTQPWRERWEKINHGVSEDTEAVDVSTEWHRWKVACGSIKDAAELMAFFLSLVVRLLFLRFWTAREDRVPLVAAGEMPGHGRRRYSRGRGI